MIKSKLNNKTFKYINNDFLKFIIPTNFETKNKKVYDVSEYQLQTTKNIIYITKNRNTTITSILQQLIKKNKLDIRIYNGKKFFNITKRFLVNNLKFGDYVFTRVNRRHILKVRTQKKTIIKKK